MQLTIFTTSFMVLCSPWRFFLKKQILFIALPLFPRSYFQGNSLPSLSWCLNSCINMFEYSKRSGYSRQGNDICIELTVKEKTLTLADASDISILWSSHDSICITCKSHCPQTFSDSCSIIHALHKTRAVAWILSVHRHWTDRLWLCCNYFQNQSLLSLA